MIVGFSRRICRVICREIKATRQGVALWSHRVVSDLYNGFRITAEALGKPKVLAEPTQEQLCFDYFREFNLTDDNGLVSVHLKRHPGQVEFSVVLKAAS
jgi:hypothetical protein